MSAHCPGCERLTVRALSRPPCPGLQCPACAAKDAEIAALEEQVADVMKEKDGIKARALAVIKARDHDLLTLRDEYSVAVGRVGVLEDALKACAEALQSVKRSAESQGYLKMRAIETALALPAVQAIVRQDEQQPR